MGPFPIYRPSYVVHPAVSRSVIIKQIYSTRLTWYRHYCLTFIWRLTHWNRFGKGAELPGMINVCFRVPLRMNFGMWNYRRWYLERPLWYSVIVSILNEQVRVCNVLLSFNAGDSCFVCDFCDSFTHQGCFTEKGQSYDCYNADTISLIHCDPMTPYDDIDLGQLWLR